MRSLPIIGATILVALLLAPSVLAQSPTDNPTPGAKPGACVDQVSPTSSFTRRSARRAVRRHARLRGTASDVGCGVDRVQIAVARKAGKKCRNLTPKRRFARKTKCSHRRWLTVAGTAKWSYRLPRHLKKGTYVIRARAIDFAGNVQRPTKRRVKKR